MAPDGMGRFTPMLQIEFRVEGVVQIHPADVNERRAGTEQSEAPPSPPPASNQPARQFDQTVGTFETRPRTSSVRSRFCRGRFTPRQESRKDAKREGG
jgi:hypothetical protein